jgi:hypothetical protein
LEIDVPNASKNINTRLRVEKKMLAVELKNVEEPPLWPSFISRE